MNADYTSGMAHFMSWSIFMGLGFMFSVAGVFVTIGGVQLTRKAEKAEKVAVTQATGGNVGMPLSAAPSGGEE
jgi:Flp pilus assembly protein protease CpaA